MNRHRRTFHAIFEKPTRSNILWSDIEKLFIALGARMDEGNGSRIRVKLNEFHRPHPRKEADKGAVGSARQFLTDAEVNEDEI